jgi:hypothetical protein
VNYTRAYKGYELRYFIQSGPWLSQDQLVELQLQLQHINSISKNKLSYGIFDPVLSLEAFREFLAEASLCIIMDQDEPVGMFYNPILQLNPLRIIHAGLVVIAKNKGIDLLKVPYCYLNLLQWRHFGSYYYTNISSTPSIVGSFAEQYRNVWPSHLSSQLKPPSKEYEKVLETVYRDYVERHFPGETQLDRKRFIIRSESKEMGFETNLRRLPRHTKLLANFFCQYWIDYSAGEDLVQVGRVDFWGAVKLYLYAFWISRFG